METVTEQPIKKIEFLRCPQSLPGVAPLTKKPEDSGYEIEFSLHNKFVSIRYGLGNRAVLLKSQARALSAPAFKR